MKSRNSIRLDNIKLHPAPSDPVKQSWVSNDDPLRQLSAALAGDSLPGRNQPMTPCITGASGIGKTTLALHCAARILHKPVYIIQCTAATVPDDILVTCRQYKKHTGYLASPLLTALLTGGVAVLDNANFLDETIWSLLLPLFDGRNFMQSPFSNSKITPHRDFRIITTANDTLSLYNIPEYIYSLLTPKIPVPQPKENEIYEILKANVMQAEDELVDYIINFMKKPPVVASIRDSINILRYSLKLINQEKYKIKDAVNTSIRLNPHLKYKQVKEEFYQLINK
ncbi:MAG TPA: AAA family ATPase [Spirochaetota bacterium]|nr:AAA family ATPase [Spirochaetota bacterium]